MAELDYSPGLTSYNPVHRNHGRNLISSTCVRVSSGSYVFKLLLVQLCFKFNSIHSGVKAMEYAEAAGWGLGGQSIS